MTSEDFQTLIDELTPDRVEWVQALDDIYNEFGEPGVREILRTLQDHVLNCGIPLAEATLNTPYINSIPPSEEPHYPGDTGLEKKDRKHSTCHPSCCSLIGLLLAHRVRRHYPVP